VEAAVRKEVWARKLRRLKGMMKETAPRAGKFPTGISFSDADSL
jgi:hypothetical protein